MHPIGYYIWGWFAMRSNNRKRFKNHWVTAFLALSVIPLLLVNIVYYYNTSKLVQQNVESMKCKPLN